MQHLYTIIPVYTCISFQNELRRDILPLNMTEIVNRDQEQFIGPRVSGCYYSQQGLLYSKRCQTMSGIKLLSLILDFISKVITGMRTHQVFGFLYVALPCSYPLQACKLYTQKVEYFRNLLVFFFQLKQMIDPKFRSIKESILLLKVNFQPQKMN